MFCGLILFVRLYCWKYTYSGGVGQRIRSQTAACWPAVLFWLRGGPGFFFWRVGAVCVSVRADVASVLRSVRVC